MKRGAGYRQSPALLAVFAHPDDESFRCGGLLALLALHGVRVQVVTATRGQSGSRGDPPLCSPEKLPEVRERELRCACKALAILPPILLDYQDGHLSEADPEGVITEILAVVDEFRPQVMLTYGPDGLSGHPDHIAIGRFATEAYQRNEGIAALYTPAMPRPLVEALGMTQIRGVPDEEITLAVDISDVWKAKMAAIQCHRTQLGQSPILEAPIEKQRLFLGTEHFLRSQARSEEDFFQELIRSMEASNV